MAFADETPPPVPAEDQYYADNTSQNIDDSELTDKEKKYANKLGDIITNKYAMQKKFRGSLGGCIVLAAVMALFYQ